MVTNKKGYMAKYCAKKRQRIIQELGGVCEGCKSDEHLVFHHKEPLNGNRPSGMPNRLVEVQKNIDNISLLCEDCHKMVHKGGS